MMAHVALQFARSSPVQRLEMQPSSHRACDGCLPRPNTDHHGLAAMQARSHRPSAAATSLAMVASEAVIVERASVSDGSRGATARVSKATAASGVLAKQPQSLPWLSAEA